MLYQEYQQKIEKLAKIRKFLFRYRVLFILLIASILSLTITLMAISGTVTEADCPTTLLYGEDFDYSAGAIMSDVSYEFSVDGVTWTNVQPTEAGTYKVRAVSRGLFGSKRTGDVHVFTIEKQPTVVRIVESSVVYGDIPTVTADLSYNDTITCTEFSFIDPTADSTTVVPIKDKIVITNEEGVDVTSSYNLQVDSSTLTIDKRQITITVSDQSTIYSDSSFTYKDFEVSSGSVAKENGFSDQVQATFSKSIKNVGEVINEASFSVVNNKGKDVTNKYQITTRIGKLTVEHRPITLVSNPMNIYYDGIDHEEKGFSIKEGSLVNGHSIVVTESTIVNNANGEGVENVQQYKIIDSKNNDVTENYAINVSERQLLVVNKRPITIQSATSQLVYTDKPQTDKKTAIISEFKLVNKDYINVIASTQLQYVSSAKNEIICQILTEEDNDNSENYEISYEYGTLEILRRNVAITVNSPTLTYNGKDQFDYGYTVTSDYDFISEHKVVIDSYPTIKYVSESGKLNTIQIHVNNAQGTNVSDDNYSITITSGKLLMVKRPIAIKSNSSTHIYDSNDYYDTSYEILNSSKDEGLVDGETITISMFTRINSVGTKDNIFDDVSIFAGTDNVTKNYNIDLSQYGKLEVTARFITFKANDKSQMYNGSPLSLLNSEFTIENTDPNEGLAPENYAVLSFSGSITDYSDVSELATITSVNIFKGSTDVTSNYNVTKKDGALTIFRRGIVVKTDTPDPFTYDSKPHSSKLFTITSANKLVDGQNLEVEKSTEITDVQYDATNNIITVDNDFITYKIVQNSVDKTNNYDISIDPGELKVIPRPITITANNGSKEYDGTALSISNIDFKEGFTASNVVTGHSTEAKVTGSIVNVFDKNNASVPSEGKVLDADNVDVTNNYAIEYVNGSLTITPKSLQIKTITPTSKVYDGTPLNGTYTVTGLCDQYDEIIADNITLTTLIDAKDNVPLKVESLLITKKDGGIDSTGNYNIDKSICGTLTVTKRNISIKSNTSSHVYDAEDYFDITFTITNSDPNEGLVEGETVNVTEYAKITNVGSTDNIFTTIQILKDDKDTTNNYNIDKSVCGTLSVTKRNITIKAKDLTKVYDGTILESTNLDYIVTNTLENEGLVAEKFNHHIVCDISGAITEYAVDGAISTLSSAAIYNSEDNNMEGNYNITLENGVLTIEKRAITVATGDKSFAYNAQAHTWDGYLITSTLGLLTDEAFGHHLVVITSTSVTNVIYDAGQVSSVNNEFTSVKILDKDDIDKTFNYDISYEEGKLTVTPAGLVITANDKSKVYDGTALTITNTEFTSTGLIDTHKLNVDISGSIVNVLDENNAAIPSNAKVFDAGDVEVTNNYTITYINGTLSITPKAITITTIGGTKVYDGTPLTGTYSVVGLCDSYDEIQSVNIKLTELTNCGNIALEVLEKKITKLVGHTDSTSNYTINVVTGYLEVTKRTIEIITNSKSKDYDGNALDDKGYTLKSETGYYTIADNQTLTILESSSITNVGSTDNSFTNITIVDENENSVINNYEITYDKGTLTINHRKITITAVDYSTEYNGTLQTQTDSTAYSITSGTLADNQSIKEGTVTFSGGQTNIGTYPSEIDINKANIIILDGNNEVQANYDITIVKGTLTITKRQINIATQSQSFVYDGNPHSYHEEGAGWIIVEGTLLNGHSIIVDSYPSVTQVSDGIINNAITFSMDSAYSEFYNITVIDRIDYSKVDSIDEFSPEIKYYTYDGAIYTIDNDVTEENFDTKRDTGLYIVSKDYSIGKLSIIPLDITITTNSEEWTYDGTSHSNSAYTVSNQTILDTLNHHISVTSYTTIKDVYYIDNEVAAMKNIIVVQILDSLDNNQSSNYNIIYVTGSLKLNPLAITVTTDSAEKVYDATPLTGTYQPVTGLATNDYYSITCPSQTDVKTIKNEAEIELYRLDTDGITHISVLGNYVITRVEGTLKVTPRTITFTIENGNWTYDGETHNRKDYILAAADAESGLLSSHTILVNDFAQIRNVGTISNYITPIIVETANTENVVTDNYNIVINKDTTLTVSKANLTITLKDAEFTYDGTVKSSNDVSTQGLAVSDYLIIEASASAIIPGEYTNTITNYIVLSSENVDASENYNILVSNGKLVINKRAITIESEEWHEIYEENKEYKHNVVTVTSETQLVDGQKLIADTITLTGKYQNGTPNTIVSYDIVDINNESISYKEYYNVTKVENLFYIGNPYIYVASPTVTKFVDQATELQSVESDFTIDSKLLLSKHSIKITNIAKLTYDPSGAPIQTIDNTFNIDIVDADGNSVIDQYDIKSEKGTLTIKKRSIKITTGKGAWVYDTETHSNDYYNVEANEMIDGHKVVCTVPTATITEPGSVVNSVTYSVRYISDNEEIPTADLEAYYYIETEFGELKVTGRPISVQTASDEMVYDSEHPDYVLTNNNVVILDSSSLFEGHVIQSSILTAANGTCTGSATETVKKDNTIDSSKFVVLDTLNGNADVTKYYELVVRKGTLTIYATEEEEKTDTKQVQITIITTTEGLIYLKTFVCGEYTLTGALPFKAATATSKRITVDSTSYSPDYIASLILQKYGKTVETATITNYIDGSYPIPYYMALGGTYTKQVSDALYAGDTSVTPYTVSYYTMSMDELREILTNGITLSSELQTEETAYYNEISDSKSQYLQIDSDTKTYMDTIISKNDLNNPNLSTYQKIVSVASYIQSSAEYSTAYNEKLDEETNIAIAFLDKYQVGVCRHFATAATMLYRALGFPARVAIGYVAKVEDANEPVDITLATYHAWVEVYVKGYGWIQVEVTGGGNIGGYNSTGEEKQEIETPDALTLTVTPVEVTEEYDGEVHTATKIEIVGSEEYDGIAALEALGYSFVYTLQGYGTVPGDYTSSILTLHIYKGDTDITDACSITKQDNKIHITKAKVTIKSSDGYWLYDGQTHEKNSYSITSGAIVEGDQEYVSCTTKIKDIGSLDNDFTYLILNSTGEDITSYYDVTKDYGELVVSKIGLTITTGSASRPYNGEPLTKDEWKLVAGTLLEDHTLTVEVTGTITDPGTAQNTATYIIKDANNNDVTNAYYVIDFQPGSLVVSSKEVTVTTTGYSRDYTGEPINGSLCTTADWTGSIDTSLYNVTLTITGMTNGSNAQSVDNTCTILITEKSTGKDVTSEYTINYDLGKLTINKIRLYVQTGSKSIYYDGVTSVSCPEYNSSTVAGLLDGTKAGGHINTIYTVQNWATLKDIPDDAVLTTNSKGEKWYRIRNSAQFVIIDENNNDVSENYELQEGTLGYLSLIKKQLSIKSGSATKEYDGTELRLAKENDTAFNVDTSTLFTGHIVIATQTGTITTVGQTDNTYDIVVEDELGNDVTKLYDIITSFGKLTITKRHVHIETGSASKDYDESPLTENSYVAPADGVILTDLGHLLKVNVTGRTEGKIENYTEYLKVRTAAGEISCKNAADAYVYMIVEGEEVVLDNLYEIEIVPGTLTIRTIELTIESQGKSKVYDGQPLTNNGDDQIATYGTPKSGHKILTNISDSVSITRVGQINNTVTYSVIDTLNGNADVTKYYKPFVREVFGFLIVTEQQITIKTGSKKSSDTTAPVTYNYYEIIDGTFYDAYTINVTGSQAVIGSSNNTYEFICDNKDCYSFVEYLGELTMYNASSPTEYAQIYSSESGTIILKEASYGEYTKTSWASATQYSEKLDDEYSMSYLNAISLSGLTPTEIRMLAYYAYTLPYFLAMDGNSIQSSDTVYSGNISTEYLVSFYLFNALNNITSLPINLGDYSADELAYRTFVYDTYLAIPSTTRSALLSRLNLSSLNSESSTYINDIINLIKNCGTNDSNYSAAIDSSSDVVISFLDLKKGISKHFATLGTLVFRLLGIPARYTVGAIGAIEANQWTSISSDNRKSYVEIYIDGFGWIPVDVTPEAGVTPPQEDDDDEKTAITIKPILTEASYTGSAITPTQKLDEATEAQLKELFPNGYTYDVSITTDEIAKTDNGKSTIVSFILKDHNGNTVYDSTAAPEIIKTYKYEVTFDQGDVKITNVQIKVYLTTVKTVYDGQAHGYGTNDVFYYFNILSTDFSKDDFAILFDKSGISLTNAGSVDYDVLRSVATVLRVATEYKESTTYYSSDGTIVSTIVDAESFATAGTVYTNVTNSFYLVFSGKGLIIEEKAITVKSASASKAFDGSTLTCDSYSITLGTLATGDTIRITITGSQTEKGSSNNTIESIFIENAGGEDVTESYDITLLEGTLTVTD